MGPVTSTGAVWQPVEPADRPSNGELELSGEKDRTSRRATRQRRRHRKGENPDDDRFTRNAQNETADEPTEE